jgi:hypothetical protein
VGDPCRTKQTERPTIDVFSGPVCDSNRRADGPADPLDGLPAVWQTD